MTYSLKHKVSQKQNCVKCFFTNHKQNVAFKSLNDAKTQIMIQLKTILPTNNILGWNANEERTHDAKTCCNLSETPISASYKSRWNLLK